MTSKRTVLGPITHFPNSNNYVNFITLILINSNRKYVNFWGIPKILIT